MTYDPLYFGGTSPVPNDKYFKSLEVMIGGVPKTLHKLISKHVKEEGVSLNQYALFSLYLNFLLYYP